jgi:hypothetical protein
MNKPGQNNNMDDNPKQPRNNNALWTGDGRGGNTNDVGADATTLS